MNDRVHVPTRWALRHFTPKQIARALRDANGAAWSHEDGWHPENDTVLDANGSRTRVGVLDWSPTRQAWQEWLAKKRGATDKNVLPISARASRAKEA